MTFFKDRFGRFYPSSRVVRLRPKSPADNFTPYPFTAVMDDGEELDVCRTSARTIQYSSSQVVAAPDGTVLLRFCADECGEPPKPFIWRHPVIGFRVGAGLEPLIVDPDFDEMSVTDAILHPCGLVDTSCGEQYESEADWFAEQVRFARVMAERKTGGASC